MATRSVRFEFYCGEAKDLKYTHNLPSRLISEAKPVGQDAAYINMFLTAIQPIMKEHKAACLTAANPFCENCGSPAVNILQTPMSWLYVPQDPFVGVWVSPICGKGGCETRVRQGVLDDMSDVGGDDPESGPGSCVEILRCKVCGKTDGVKKCDRCRVAGYCGREHQKLDWKIHKKQCVPKQE